MRSVPQPRTDSFTAWANLDDRVKNWLAVENIHGPQDWKRTPLEKRRMLFGITRAQRLRCDEIARWLP